MNGVIEIFGGMGKNFWSFQVCSFIHMKVNNKQGVPGYPGYTLLS